MPEPEPVTNLRQTGLEFYEDDHGVRRAKVRIEWDNPPVDPPETETTDA